jgi:hypothetical protein
MFSEIYEGFGRLTGADWTTICLVFALLTWGIIKIDKLVAILAAR